MTRIVSAAKAAESIVTGSSVACVGVIGWSTPDAVLAAIAHRFAAEKAPRDLTFFFPVATGDSIGIPGMDHVAEPGLMKRIISGSYVNPRHPVTGQRSRVMALVNADGVEAYSWPIGATMHWLREVARRSPGYITRVGLGTYIDPRQTGGRMTARASEPLVELVQLRGEEFLFYPTWPINVGVIRATSADDCGNLSFERDPLISASLAIALAVRASEGTVIAQVERVVPRGSRPAHEVKVPGCLVDLVVVDGEQMMTTDVRYDAAYLGGGPEVLQTLADMPHTVDKVIARRAAREVRSGEVSIFGFGASADIPRVMVEDGLLTRANYHDYVFTTEHGSFGGVVMGGWQFSANIGPSALIEGATQFDAIDGGLCAFAGLAFAEFDAAGRVNVSKFGDFNPGAGGFIDIAQNARRLVFTGTFTTGGLEVEFGASGPRIMREGRVRKFVPQVQEITYDVAAGVGRGQQALIVTERAVFLVRPDGLELIEVAPGIDVRRNVIDQMEFAPVAIRDPLPTSDRMLFAANARESLGASLT
jgi:propionate CoA-transferase